MLVIAAWEFWKEADFKKAQRERLARKTQREPITFTYENFAVFLEQPEDQFTHGDIVILRDTGKRYKRDGDAWMGVSA